MGDTDVEIKLDGYETRLITLSKEFNVISVLNLASLPAWAIDAVTGSVMKYDRKSYDVTLRRRGTAMFMPTRIHIDTEKQVIELYIQELQASL